MRAPSAQRTTQPDLLAQHIAGHTTSSRAVDLSNSAVKVATAAASPSAGLALLAEYAAPETTEHLRTALQDAALAYCEQRLQDAPDTPLSISLAVLAAQAERIGSSPAVKAQLEQNVLAQLPENVRPDDAADMLDATYSARLPTGVQENLEGHLDASGASIDSTKAIERFAEPLVGMPPEQQTAFAVKTRAELLQKLVLPELADSVPAVPTLSQLVSSASDQADDVLMQPLARTEPGEKPLELPINFCIGILFTGTTHPSYRELRTLDRIFKNRTGAATSMEAAQSDTGQFACRKLADTALPKITFQTSFQQLVDRFVRDFDSPPRRIFGRTVKMQTEFAKFGEELKAAAQTTGGEVCKATALLVAVDRWLADPANADSKKAYAVTALRLKLVEYAESEEVRLKGSPEHPERKRAETLVQTARGVSGSPRLLDDDEPLTP